MCDNEFMQEKIRLSGHWPIPILTALKSTFQKQAIFLIENTKSKQELIPIADLTGLISAACAIVTLCLYIMDRKRKTTGSNSVSIPTIMDANAVLKTRGILQSEIRKITVECHNPLRMTIHVAKSVSYIERSFHIIEESECLNISSLD